jgi:hypothetical protein
MKLVAYHDEWYPFYYMTDDQNDWNYKNSNDGFIDVTPEEFTQYTLFMEELEHWQSFIENRIKDAENELN